MLISRRYPNGKPTHPSPSSSSPVPVAPNGIIRPNDYGNALHVHLDLSKKCGILEYSICQNHVDCHLHTRIGRDQAQNRRFVDTLVKAIPKVSSEERQEKEDVGEGRRIKEKGKTPINQAGQSYVSPYPVSTGGQTLALSMGSPDSQSLSTATTMIPPSIQERLDSEYPGDHAGSISLVSNYLEEIIEQPSRGLTTRLDTLLRQRNEIDELRESDIHFASMLWDALRQFRGKALEILVHWIGEYVIRHREDEMDDADDDEFQDALDEPANAEEELT